MTFQQKRSAAQISASAIFLILLALAAGLLWSKWRNNTNVNEEAILSLDQLRSIAAYGKVWKPSQDANDENISALFLQDASLTVVDANLQTMVKALGTQSAVDVSRTSVSTPRVEGQLVWHDVTIDVTGTNSALVQFIQSLETTKPALLIGHLQIQSNIQPGIPLQTEPVMSAQLTVSGATRTIDPAKNP